MVELDEEERKELKEIKTKAYIDNLIIKIEKNILLRKIARKRGIITDNLEDLKSEKGEQFIEIASEKKPSPPFPLDLPRRIKLAVVSGKSGDFSSEEVAYFCQMRYWKQLKKQLKLEKDPTSCGWVKGVPEKEWYDEISFLSGSNGWKYICRICGQELARIEFAIS